MIQEEKRKKIAITVQSDNSKTHKRARRLDSETIFLRLLKLEFDPFRWFVPEVEEAEVVEEAAGGTLPLLEARLTRAVLSLTCGWRSGQSKRLKGCQVDIFHDVTIICHSRSGLGLDKTFTVRHE